MYINLPPCQGDDGGQRYRDGVLHVKAENHWIFLTRRFIDLLIY